MKLSEYKKVKNEYTSKVSEISRQLSLGGIAIIWIFHKSDGSGGSIDRFLILPLISLSLGIVLDLLQYVVGGEIWKQYYKKQEKKLLQEFKTNDKVDIDPERKAPARLKTPIEVLYWSKVILLVFSYIMIIIFLIENLSFK
jgi:predicted SPOUT superfamily RNA methylase MTH1